MRDTPADLASGTAPLRRGAVIASVTALTQGSSRGRIGATAFEIAVPLYLTVLLWRGLYAGQQEVAGVTHDQAVTYAVIAALLTYLRVGNRAWVRDAMVQHIRLGTIVYWFLWPMKPAVYHAIRGAGDLAFASLWVIPSYLICLVTGAIVPPVDGVAALSSTIAFLLGQVVVYLIWLLLDLICFWTLVNEQILQMVSFVQALLSGGFAPLWFFPEWFQMLSVALPFHCIVNIPMSIYIGQATGGSVALLLLQQVAWCLVLGMAGTVLWRRAAGRLEVHGG